MCIRDNFPYEEGVTAGYAEGPFAVSDSYSEPAADMELFDADLGISGRFYIGLDERKHQTIC